MYPIPNESNMKIFLLVLERDIQCDPGSLLFCKLNIIDLLFSIKGISSFEKVFRYDFSFFNKSFMKILLRGYFFLSNRSGYLCFIRSKKNIFVGNTRSLFLRY